MRSPDIDIALIVGQIIASKSPSPGFTDQAVNWTAALASQETVTLTIQAQAISAGLVTNQAIFSGS